MKTLGLRRNFFYGLGNTGLAIVNIAVQTWLIYFFAPPEGRVLIPAGIVGSIWFFGRIVDAVSDPIISNWSDRLDSVHGRRIPFLLFSSVPLAVVMVALFYEPLFSGSLIVASAVLALLLGLFYFLFTAYAVPYLSMIADLSNRRSDRLNLSTSSALFNLIGTALAMILCGFLISRFSPGDDFSSAAFIPAMVILGAVGVVTFLATPLGLYGDRKKGSAGTPLNLVKAMKLVLRNKPFVRYVIGMNVFWGGFIIINVSVPYYVTVLMRQSVGFTSVALGVSLGVALCFFPVINGAARRFGNRKVILCCCLGMAVTLSLIALIPMGLLGLSPKAFGLILMGLAGAPMAGLFIIPNAMVAELSDFSLPDGTKPGEAIYYGVQGIINKFVIGVVTASTGLLFELFGRSVEEPLGVKLTGPIGGVFALFAFFMFLKYPADVPASAEGKRTVKRAN